jgi:hypothetical protein
VEIGFNQESDYDCSLFYTSLTSRSKYGGGNCGHCHAFCLLTIYTVDIDRRLGQCSGLQQIISWIVTVHISVAPICQPVHSIHKLLQNSLNWVNLWQPASHSWPANVISETMDQSMWWLCSGGSETTLWGHQPDPPQIIPEHPILDTDLLSPGPELVKLCGFDDGGCSSEL